MGSQNSIPDQSQSIRTSQIELEMIADPQTITKLQRHIEHAHKYKILKENFIKANSLNETMKQTIKKKQLENKKLFKSIQSYQQQVKSISLKFQQLQSHYNDSIIEQSTEARTQQNFSTKQTHKNIDLNHRFFKKNNHSQLLLPSPPGSSHKFVRQKKSQYNLFSKEQQNEEAQPIRGLLRNAFSGQLLDSSQKNIRQQQFCLLLARIAALKKETIKLRKQVERLNNIIIQKEKKENHLNFELNHNRDKLKSNQKQNKLINEKLKQAEEKIAQLTLSLKQKREMIAIETLGSQKTIQIYQDDKFYAQSSFEQIKSMIERIHYNLQIESYTVDLYIYPPPKQSTCTQTTQQMVSAISAKQKAMTLQILICELQDQILMKQQQHKNILEQQTLKHKQQIKQYIDAIYYYQFKIEQYILIIKKYQADRNNWLQIETYKNPEQSKKQSNNNKIKTIDNSAQCDMLPVDFVHQRQQILQKAKMLLQFNEQQAKTIQNLNEQVLRLRNDLISSPHSNKNQKYLITDSTDLHSPQIFKTDQTQFLNYHIDNNQKGYTLHNSLDNIEQVELDDMMNLKLKRISEQRDYFNECYSQSLHNIKILQQQYQSQTNKIKQEQQQNEKYIKDLQNELAHKTLETTLLKQQIQQCQLKIKMYQNDIDYYKIEHHQMQQICRKLQNY